MTKVVAGDTLNLKQKESSVPSKLPRKVKKKVFGYFDLFELADRYDLAAMFIGAIGSLGGNIWRFCVSLL